MTRMVLLLVLTVLAGCASGGDEVDGDRVEANRVNGDRAGRALEQQRLDVRAGADDLVTALEGGMGGTLTDSSGQFRGCEGAFDDEFENFHYLVQARVDVTLTPSVGAVGGAVEEAGLTEAGTRPVPGGGQSVGFTRGDLRGSVTFYPDQPFVVLDVSGPCIDVPEDQRDDWLHKDEPSPHLR